MSTLLLSILGLSIGAQQCVQWREIAPCTCRKDTSIIIVSCDKMSSYAEIVNTLQNKFSPSDRVELRIGFSSLDDLPQRNFREINTTVEKIQLHHDNLRHLSASTFVGLTRLNLLSLADNNIGIVPEHILETLPNVRTLDLGRVGIHQLFDVNFKNTPQLQNIMLGGNLITQMESNSIPRNIRQLHLGRNKIKELNGTLTNLTELEWVFINANELTSLENQLPITAPRLVMIHAAYNKIEKLPQHLRTYANLESLFIHNNMLTSLDGVLSKLHKLERASFENNKINTLTREDFLETDSLQCLCMGNNHITSLNNSLQSLRGMGILNMTHNLIAEFSLEEIKGLQKLRTVDLSYNKIVKLTGPTANVVEWETKLTELILNHNEIEHLNGALSGLTTLIKLNLSFNKLTLLSPDDLIGLDRLEALDISYNKLTTLEETGKTVLPSLSELIASFNYLTILERDFHGLPVLCWADLSNNKIVALGKDLVSNTRCKKQDTEGTLKILLQDNPILCDAALPEIVSAMEINHTRVIGVSHCGPLNEQPTTAKPNGFYGFIPEDIYESHIISQKVEYLESSTAKPNNFSNRQNQTRLIPITDLLLSPTIDRNTHQYEIQNQNEQIINLNLSQIYNMKLADSQQSENNNVELNVNPLTTLISDNKQHNELPEKHILHNTQAINTFEEQLLEENEQNIKSVQKNGQVNIAHINPIVHQEQINALASQIEELRLKVEELSAQNKILSGAKVFRNNALSLQESNYEIMTKEKHNDTEEISVHTKPLEISKDKVESLETL